MKPKYMLIVCLSVLLAGKVFAQEASGEEVVVVDDEELVGVSKLTQSEPEPEPVDLDVQVDEDAVEVIDENDQTETAETIAIEPTKSASETTLSRSGKYLSYDDYNFNFNERQELPEVDNNYNYGKLDLYSSIKYI